MGLFSRKSAAADARPKSRPSISGEAQARELRVRARRRLIGALALVLAVVIVAPMLFETTPESPQESMIVVPMVVAPAVDDPLTQAPDSGASGGGVIINTASLQSFISFPRTAAYTAAKHGVLGLTRTIAKEYGPHGIRCNAVAPGIVATPMTQSILEAPQWHTALVQQIPLGRVAQPADIARAVVWLSSSDAQYVNGACLPVDGGYLA